MTQLLTEHDVAKILKVSVHKLRRDRCKGGGIPFVKLSGAVRYSHDAVEGWIQERTVKNTSVSLEERRERA